MRGFESGEAVYPEVSGVVFVVQEGQSRLVAFVQRECVLWVKLQSKHFFRLRIAENHGSLLGALSLERHIGVR